MNASGSEPDLRDHLTIMAVSASVLVLQIALTRVLSVVVWYHFAFLTLSMVMLGLGAPGLWLSFIARPQRWLAPSLVASGLLVPLSVAYVVQAGALALQSSAGLIVLVVLPGMLALGTTVCLLLMKAEGPRIGRMYGADLLGACLGAAVVIPLMALVPTPLLAAGCGLPPLLALALRGRTAALVALGCTAVLAVAMGGTDLFEVTRSKTTDERDVPPIVEVWTPTARLTVFGQRYEWLEEHQQGFSWGRGTRAPPGRALDQLWLEQDGHAGTPITRFDGDLDGVRHLLYDVTTVGYQVRPPRRAAVIGAGGGRDVLSALLGGAEQVVAIELNGAILELVRLDFGEFSGGLYDRSEVDAVASEGRSYLTHAEDRYDLLQISLIDSWAASAAGAFALAENNLYTVEAFQLYRDRLSDPGLLSVSRWQTELPRLVILARAALEADGIQAPERHLAVVSAGKVATLMVSKIPWTDGELARIDTVCAERGFERLYPGDTMPWFRSLVEGDTRVLSEAGIHTEPPTDDSPYFFQVVSPFRDPEAVRAAQPALTGLEMNFRSTIVLRSAMGATTALATLLFLVPFLSPGLRRRLTGTEPQQLPRFLAGSLYFAAIGAGFMLLENLLVQRLVLYLGHPSYAVSVIIASLLLGMGLGASASGRIGVAGLRRHGWAVGVAVVVGLWALSALVEATLGLSQPVRVLIAATLLTPAGAALGLFFPLGMQCFGETLKPWFWAVNGAFGVVAGVMSLAFSMAWGFAVVGWLAAACYGLGWLCLPRSAGPRSIDLTHG